ncbi:MAG: hypothetical protein DRO39_00120 [Thermoprotei archaeon]|nr:MAG: hypothetical protein DRO39_00120 [Thermoprotei archaeon]
MHEGLVAALYTTILLLLAILISRSVYPYAFFSTTSLILLMLSLLSAMALARTAGPLTASAVLLSVSTYAQNHHLLMLIPFLLLVQAVWEGRNAFTRDALLASIRTLPRNAKDSIEEYCNNPLGLVQSMGYALLSGGAWLLAYVQLAIVPSINLYAAGYVLNTIVALLTVPRGVARIIGYILIGGSIPYTVPLALLALPHTKHNIDNPREE